MQVDKDPKRNKPADEGKDNDPDLRDRSGIQPGVSTISKSDNDADNENLTETGKGNEKDSRADRTMDEVDYD
ncbi:MAG: hypothetical protein ACJ749_06575 [Flavisolibacter sp.]